MEKVCVVVLAAGDGKRMKSTRPKVLSQVLFKPMISWVTESCQAAGIASGCVVLGNGSELVTPLLPQQFTSVLQAQRKGTGHAASMAREFLLSGGFKHTAVLNGDAPFISPQDLQGAYELHVSSGNAATVISAKVEDPHGYGRIIRQGDQVTAIVEEKDTDDSQRAVSEINSGAFWFDTAALLQYFDKMTCSNAQGEYYLTDALAFVLSTGGKVGAYVAAPETALGANSRSQLAQLNELARQQVLERHRENGVDIPFADGVVIGPDVQIGADTVILPGSILGGSTVVGTGCEIGPNSNLQDAILGNDCRIISSYIDSSTLKDGVKIGPMSNVRPGCVIHDRVKVGDFVELKNSVVGSRTSVAHLTYVGDSDVGSGCNFGCGVVTVNYDGESKYRTVVGDDVFIGCNTNLVAPVSVGDRVYAAAGTTVTENVPAGALVIGRARQVIKPGWVDERGRYRKK